MTLVSIGMPVYNKEDFLKQALDSILGQTFQDFELIIVDDKSTDNSMRILEEYSDDRIKIYHNECNLGQAGSLNKCWELANGKYITFAHGDDIWHEQFLEKHVELLEKYPNTYISHALEHIINKHGNIIETEPANDINKYKLHKAKHTLKQLARGCCIHTPTVMLRNSKEFRFNNRFPVTLDWDLWLRIAARSLKDNKKIIWIKYPLIQYRCSEDNVTATTKASGEAILDAYMMLIMFFSDYENNKFIKKLKHLAFYRLSMRTIRLSRNLKTKKDILTYLKLAIIAFPANVLYPVLWLYFICALTVGHAGMGRLANFSHQTTKFYKKIRKIFKF